MAQLSTGYNLQNFHSIPHIIISKLLHLILVHYDIEKNNHLYRITKQNTGYIAKFKYTYLFIIGNSMKALFKMAVMSCMLDVCRVNVQRKIVISAIFNRKQNIQFMQYIDTTFVHYNIL